MSRMAASFPPHVLGRAHHLRAGPPVSGPIPVEPVEQLIGELDEGLLARHEHMVGICARRARMGAGAVGLRAMAARVVVTRRIPEPALERLRAAAEVEVSDADRALEPDELHALVAGADAVVTMLHDRVDAAFLDAAGPQLRVVANVAVGYDNVDVDAAGERDVVVTNTPGVLTDATADLAIALTLAVTRRIGEGERLIRSGAGWAWAIDFMLGTSLQGKTLGIVGYGAIGRATAGRARAFGMRIA
jgi:glyoxylate reductase